MAAPAPAIAVIGPSASNPAHDELARATGRAIAASGAVLLCGGGGGAMAAAAAGAREGGGRAVGILPGLDASDSPPNPHLDLALYTGLGQARNLVVVLSARAVIAVGGGWGTLSEIALALKHRIPVVLLDSWELERPDGEPEPLLLKARTPAEAVELAGRAAQGAPARGRRE